MEHLHKSIARVTDEAVSGSLRQLFLGRQIGRWFDVDLDNGHLVAFRPEWRADNRNRSTQFHLEHFGFKVQLSVNCYLAKVAALHQHRLAAEWK